MNVTIKFNLKKKQQKEQTEIKPKLKQKVLLYYF